jgi:thiopurine S-methyltransferase
MELKYWQDKWKTGDTKFHLPDFHPALVKFFPADPPGTVFVPLCGKSRDMLWFLEKGWRVIGAEAVEPPCRDFFAENNLEYSEEERGPFRVFRAERVSLLCGDVFALGPKDMAGVTAVYDRAALFALPPDVRKRYAAHLHAILPPGVKYFLVSMEYPQEKVVGPPFSVDAAEIRRLYGDAFSVTELNRRPDAIMPVLNAKFAGVEVWQTAYMLS